MQRPGQHETALTRKQPGPKLYHHEHYEIIIHDSFSYNIVTWNKRGRVLLFVSLEFYCLVGLVH